jgi:hypothetical protein
VTTSVNRKFNGKFSSEFVINSSTESFASRYLTEESIRHGRISESSKNNQLKPMFTNYAHYQWESTKLWCHNEEEAIH